MHGDIRTTSWINVTRGMVIISVILSFLTLALGVTSIIKENVPFSFAAVSALAKAAAMLAIFVEKVHEEDNSYTGLGWSFGIGWAGVGFYMMGMIAWIYNSSFCFEESR